MQEKKPKKFYSILDSRDGKDNKIKNKTQLNKTFPLSKLLKATSAHEV